MQKRIVSNYNGKELQTELDLNVYDYHARMYDPAIGRMQQIDPHAAKYEPVSLYNYVVNNPLNFVDPDGKDYRLNIYQDNNGNWQINISTTVHVFSDNGNTESKAKEYNKFIANNTKALNGVYTIDGTEYRINVNIEYKVGEKDKKGNVMNFSKGDNRLELEQGAVRKNRMGAHGITHFSDRSGFGYTGNLVVMDNDYGYYSSAGTVTHDILHQMGLGDRYYEYPTEDSGSTAPGFKNDIMANGPGDIYYRGNPMNVNQIHWNNYGNTIIGDRRVRNRINKKGNYNNNS